MKKLHKVSRRLACLVALVLAAAAFATPAEAVMGMLSVPLPTAVTTPVKEQPSNQKAVAVHLSASASSAKVGYMEVGRQIKVLGSSGSYYRVDCSGMSGYIRKDLVRQENGCYYIKYVSGAADNKVFTARSLSETVALRNKMNSVAKAQVGIRYLSGGSSRNGFDCCGFTSYVYRNSQVDLPRSVEDQLGNGLIISKDELQCGDLVLFHRTNHPTYYVTHVGMYLGNGKLIHAGSGGIGIVNMSDAYFATRFLGARRYLVTDTLETENPTGASQLPLGGNQTSWVRRREVPTP